MTQRVRRPAPLARDRQLADRLAAVGTVASAAVAILGALSMRDHVRLVDIVVLFAGGVGTGAGIATFAAGRRAARGERGPSAYR